MALTYPKPAAPKPDREPAVIKVAGGTHFPNPLKRKGLNRGNQ